MNQKFDLLDPKAKPGDPARRAALDSRSLPASLRSHTEGAKSYQPSAELVIAVNTALAVSAPLLLTGEPGTGKTQVAFYLAWYFGIEESVFPLYVRSTTTASDLEYRFDSVAYFRHDAARDGAKPKGDFVEEGPLWKAFGAVGPAVVLLDEVDKAPRDFPNDILNVLDQHRFHVPERDLWVARPAGKAPPLVIITSNSERRLPEPFLRRCVFHNIELTPDLIRRAVAAHGSAFPRVDEDLRDAAIERFNELRGRGLRKKPATSELLVWLAVLSARGDVSASVLRTGPLRDLPALGALVKDRDDLQQL